MCKTASLFIIIAFSHRLISLLFCPMVTLILTAILLGNLSQGEKQTVFCYLRFLREGIPVTDEQHQFNVSVGHRTSRNWRATAHAKAQVIVSSPLRVDIHAYPISLVTGFAKLMSRSIPETKDGTNDGATCNIDDLIAVLATIRNVSSFSLDIARTTLVCRNNAEIRAICGHESPSSSQNIVKLAPHDNFSEVFVMQANKAVDGPAGILGSLRCAWQRPSTIELKDASQVMNFSTVDLPRLLVANQHSVSVKILSPSDTVVGEVFDMLLEVQNRGTSVTSVQFSMRLGSDFLCAGRMRGSQVVQPESISRTRFRLIGVTPGNMELPAVIVKAGEQETIVVDGEHAGSILVLPKP